jgi:hypothetical protein
MKAQFLNILIASFVLLITTTQCAKENMGDCVKSTGKVVSQFRSFSEFNKLTVEDNVNVYITFGNENLAWIEAGENLQKLIITDVASNQLTIRNDNKCNWVRSFEVPINVYLQCTELTEIFSYGYGVIETIDTLKTDVFLSEQWLASGNIKLKIQANEVYLKTHTGVGDYECSGTTQYLYLYSSSHGKINAQETSSTTCYVWNNGTGDFRVNASDSLLGKIENLGDVYYNNNVQHITTTTSGEGLLIAY